MVIHRETVTQFCFISMPAVFRHHVLGKVPRYLSYCDTAKIWFVSKLMIIWAFFLLN